MKNLLKSQSGLSMMELLISVSVLGFFLVLFIGFQSEYIKNFSKLSIETGDNASLRAIQEEILKDQRFIVPMTSIPSLEVPNLSPDVLAASFAQAKTETRCYDKSGSRVNASPEQDSCHYAATFYRVMMKDRRFPANSVYAKVPVSRLNIRISYPKADPGKDPKAKKEKQTIYFSKIVTHVLPY